MSAKTGILDGVTRTQSTLIFENQTVKDKLKLINKKGESYLPEDVLKAHTLKVEFDFNNLTQDEIVNALVSTTSFMKQFQNNILKSWDEETILEACKSTYKLSIRNLLDNRKQQAALSIEQRVRREINKRIKKGDDAKQVIADVEKLVAELKGAVK